MLTKLNMSYLKGKLRHSTDTFITATNLRSDIDEKINSLGDQVKQLFKKQDVEYMSACKKIIEHKNGLMKSMYELCKSRDDDYKAFALQKHCTNEQEMGTLRKDAAYFYRYCNKLKERIAEYKNIVAEKNTEISQLKANLKQFYTQQNAVCLVAARMSEYINDCLNQSNDVHFCLEALSSICAKLETPIPFDKLADALDGLKMRKESPIKMSFHTKKVRVSSALCNRSADNTIQLEAGATPYNDAKTTKIAMLKSKLAKVQRNMSSKYFQTSELEAIFINCIEELKKMHPTPIHYAIKKCSDSILQGRVLTKEEKIEIASSFIANEKILKIVYEALFPKRATYISAQDVTL